MRFFRAILFLIMCSAATSTVAQTKAELEARRKEIQKEIASINSILVSTQEREKSLLEEVEDLQLQIKSTEKLIRVYNQEANLITQNIDKNTLKIDRLRTDLEQLKTDYALMIKQSYRSKNKQNRIMFLLSSASFFQAYKRLQYMKQYANYRKQQGIEIQEKTIQLQQLNEQLFVQRQNKEAILAENRKAKVKLVDKKANLDQLIKQIKLEEKNYQNELERKQKAIAKIDQEIERLIKEAIARENAIAGSKSSTRFKLTPEAKALADNFADNKGKLPWPVVSGIVSTRFGKHRHPIVKTAMIESNGVRIDTEVNSNARAIFEGTVSQINKIPGANIAVMIRHGDYISVYNNLAEVFVEPGDKVFRNQDIGRVGINSSSGKTTLFFQLFKNLNKLNPEVWIYKM
ncbi:murein hydrolase activator EnvC family protein [Psychroflexus sp. ALD_RP9]|uniref:murein hydrolase activator EnvC family protein n=1 Tax=Psychroflexus sp. ALD_RP9 TaxID=2777186 RepID=UPI001A8F26CD|nr:peptidoglycan DD-metalloendopeptidase family protein [Psychroflexus sp. ALD_RP9]QSS97917.1 peptidoglycan DD-metalloendopeptidase family protein [Psychroflexus sp. ALD_RP9]